MPDKAPERRVIQIAFSSNPIRPDAAAYVVVALCDDGSLWWRNLMEDDLEWCRVPPVPGTGVATGGEQAPAAY
jgi:hypothetical protein